MHLGGRANPREVVQEVQDLDLGAVFELPEGDVCLPRLVRQQCLEADVGALGALVRLRVTKPRRLSTRQMLDSDGGDGSVRLRW